MSISDEIKRQVDLHISNTDPRSLSEQFPGLHPDDETEARRLTQSDLTLEKAVEITKGKRQLAEIREKMGNVLGKNWLGNSWIGKLANRVRNKIMLLD